MMRFAKVCTQSQCCRTQVCVAALALVSLAASRTHAQTLEQRSREGSSERRLVFRSLAAGHAPLDEDRSLAADHAHLDEDCPQFLF